MHSEGSRCTIRFAFGSVSSFVLALSVARASPHDIGTVSTMNFTYGEIARPGRQIRRGLGPREFPMEMNPIGAGPSIFPLFTLRLSVNVAASLSSSFFFFPFFLFYADQ